MGWTDAGRRKAALKRKGRHLSKATKDKISKALRGKKHPHKGHPQSKTARERISAALKGKKHPHKGHKMSAATRAKISAALKGKHHLRKKLGNYQASRRLKPRFRFDVRSGKMHGLTNTQVLNMKLRKNIHGTRKMTNTSILSAKEHRGIMGGGRVSNKWVIKHHVPQRRRSKRSRLAK